MSIRSVVRGIIAGVGVKFFMQYAIILLGRAAGPHYNWVSLINNLLAHTFFFGVQQFPRSASRSFMRDIGERNVEQFHPTNICDLIERAPFTE
jgi:hypothetical protein